MKIAVMGSHPATKMQAPFDDPEWKIWACSPHNFRDPSWHTIFNGVWVWPDMYIIRTPPNFPQGALPRVDEWFEVHPQAKHKSRDKDYLEFVRQLSEKIPVWMQDLSDHPNARKYPTEEVIEEFGPFMLTSSIAYILAKAIMAKPEAIGLWGVMQATTTEKEDQLPGIKYFLSEANRRGIKVCLPEQAAHIFKLPEDKW